LAAEQRDDVLGSVRRETSEPVGEDQLVRGGRLVRCAAGAMSPRRHEARHLRLGRRPARQLLRQAPPAVGEDRPGHRLHEDAILVRNLLGPAHEDPAGAVDHVRLDARGDEPHDPVLQHLAVAAAVLVPDHQVHGEALQAPVRVRLHHLADELDVVRIAHLQQHDRQVARDGVAPEARLPAAVAQQHGRQRAQPRVGVEHGAREARVELRIGLRRIDLPQRHPAVGPREVEDAVGEAAVLVFADEGERGLAPLGHAGSDVDRRRLLRPQDDAMPDRGDRVQHRALAARQALHEHRMRRLARSHPGR
jgi:hypothetical protein